MEMGADSSIYWGFYTLLPAKENVTLYFAVVLTYKVRYRQHQQSCLLPEIGVNQGVENCPRHATDGEERPNPGHLFHRNWSPWEWSVGRLEQWDNWCRPSYRYAIANRYDVN